VSEIDQGDGSTFAGERLDDPLADPARRSRDDSDLSGEIEVHAAFPPGDLVSVHGMP
jgi:hypothetical protein